jgi:hypothetical protein
MWDSSVQGNSAPRPQLFDRVLGFSSVAESRCSSLEGVGLKIRTYLLVQSEESERSSLVELLRALPGAESVAQVRGPYDIVARLVLDAGRGVERIRELPGIKRVVACAIP